MGWAGRRKGPLGEAQELNRWQFFFFFSGWEESLASQMETLPFLASLRKPSSSSFTKVDSYGLSSLNHTLPFRSFCCSFGS